MKLDEVKQVYFVGIGGIGMSAIARWFKAQGLPVEGYDKTSTPLTQALEQEGILVHYEDSISQISKAVLDDPKGTLVVYTPAIPADHKEFNFFKDSNYRLMKRAQVLGLIASGHFTIAVAGTHGKTTTSSMVAWLLHHAGLNCTAFLGGIATNFNSNLLLAAKPDEQLLVVEADEYDRSFLTLHPNVAVVTSTDPDHLDIYGQHEELKRTFGQFVSQIKPDGHLFRQQTLEATLHAPHTHTYSFQAGDLRAENLRPDKGMFKFDVVSPWGNIADLELVVPGFHNVENALAAIGIAQLLKVDGNTIREGIAAYQGVKRRFEYVVRNEQHIYIDDYAHHPREIEALLTSVRALYPGKKMLVIFQPHLYSRTRDFAEGFAQSLSLADELVLLDIYPARELPITGVSSEMIYKMVDVDKKILLSKENVLDYLRKSGNIGLLCTVGAGDIDTLVNPIREYLLAH